MSLLEDCPVCFFPFTLENPPTALLQNRPLNLQQGQLNDQQLVDHKAFKKFLKDRWEARDQEGDHDDDDDDDEDLQNQQEDQLFVVDSCGGEWTLAFFLSLVSVSRLCLSSLVSLSFS